MNDPYQVLGVSRSASDDEIKKAYRSLSRTYHPDSNIGKSEKEKAYAEEKFKEIQAAYKAIMDGTAKYGDYGSTSSRQSSYGGFGGFGGYGNTYGGYSNQNRSTSYSADTDRNASYYRAVENFLRNRMYAEAMRALGDITDRNGQWYYYAALASAGMGNMMASKEYIQRAIILEPTNMEYRNFESRMGDTPGWYTEVGRNYGAPEANNNNLCCYLCLASTFCGGPCGGIPLFCCL